MNSQKRIVSILAFASALLFATSASATSQRDQQQAAQRAYEASARDHAEVARGFEQAKSIAEAVRDTAVEVLRNAR